MWAEAHSDGTGAVWAEAAQQWDGGGVRGGAQQWDGGGVRGGVQQWDGGGVGGGAQQWDGGGGLQEGGVPGQPEPEDGGAYQRGPLSSTIDCQALASSEQQVEWPTLFAAHLMSIGKWHALSVWDGLVGPTRPGSNVLIEDNADSIHCTGHFALF